MLDKNTLKPIPMLPKRVARKALLDAKTFFNMGVIEANQFLAELRFKRTTGEIKAAVCAGSKVTRRAHV